MSAVMAKTNAELLREAEVSLAEFVRRGNKQLLPALTSVRGMQSEIANLTGFARRLAARFGDASEVSPNVSE